MAELITPARQAINVGYLVETPITREKKMYGAQLSFVALISELAKFGIAPFVVVSEEWEMTDALRGMGVSVLTTPIWEFFRSLDGVYEAVHEPEWQSEQERQSEQKVVGYFRENNVQLVHMNTRFAGLLGARVARTLRVPYLYHIREFLAEDFGLAFKDEQLAQELIGGADSLIAISQSVREHLNLEYPSSTVRLIYNGVDIEKYRFQAPQRCAGPVIRLALVGRVVEHKGQFDAIKAIQALPDEVRTKVELNIVGYRPDEITPYEQFLIDYVNEHSLEHAVRFVPFTNDVPLLLRDFDIGLMCSSKEAFGRVTVEYMLSRLLVIGSASGGTAEIISHGRNGLLYQAGDHEDLASQITNAINDPDSTRSMISTAYEDAIAQFSASLNALNVYNVYREVLQSRASAPTI